MLKRKVTAASNPVATLLDAQQKSNDKLLESHDRILKLTQESLKLKSKLREFKMKIIDILEDSDLDDSEQLDAIDDLVSDGETNDEQDDRAER